MTGVFTTLLSLGGKPRYLDEHLARLHAHAGVVQYLTLNPSPPSGEGLEGWGVKLSSSSPLRIRLTINEAGPKIEIEPFVLPDASIYEGVEIFVSKVQVDYVVKTTDRTLYNLAKAQASDRGAFEALLIDNEGYVVDGSRTSPLLYKDGKLISLSGGLDGITRRHVLKEATRLGCEVSEQRLKPNELRGQLLLAGTGVGLVPVGKPVDNCVRSLIEQFRLSF